MISRSDWLTSHCISDFLALNHHLFYLFIFTYFLPKFRCHRYKCNGRLIMQDFTHLYLNPLLVAQASTVSMYFLFN